MGQQTLPNPTPLTIAHRMSRITTGPHGRQSDDGVAQQITLPTHAAPIAPPYAAPPPVAPPPAPNIQSTGPVSSRLRSSGDVLPVLSSWDFHDVLTDTSFDPSCPVDEYDEVVDGCWVPHPPRLITPSSSITAGHVEQNLFVGVAEEDVLYSFSTPDASVKVQRSVSHGVPDRMVRYPWGDVPYKWAAGYDNSIMYQTEIDCTVDSCVFTSLESGDDPSYAQAMKGPERQQWIDAKEDELSALRGLGVIKLVPADSVPEDEDIYDTMALCKKKRGYLNTLIKHKIRIVLCGNQIIAATARRNDALGTDKLPPLRTHSPTIRHCCYKLVTGAAVCRGMRRRGFDVKWAYLQGDGKYMGKKVWARAPFDCLLYDERGVEYIWEVVKPLYGGPDSGRAWYLTFTSWLLSPAGMEFLRCDADTCLFDRVLDKGRST